MQMKQHRPIGYVVAAILGFGAAATIGSTGHAQTADHPARLIQTLDLNRDGALDRAEFLAARTDKFETVDADSNGVISRDEFDAVVERFRALHGLEDVDGQTRNSPVFGALDSDGDNLISQAEFDAAAEALFLRFDRNGDGLLTPEDRSEG
jgi:Ca2+-binding EF-hand superfamily protein